MAQGQNANHDRPTSKGELVWLQTVAGIASLPAAVSLGVNLLPDSGSANPLLYVPPVLVGLVVGIALIILWHKVLKYAAHTRHVHERVFAAAGGVVLTCFALATSVWFLVTVLSGSASQRMHRAEFIGQAEMALRQTGRNASAETQVIGAVCSSRDNLLGLGGAEGSGKYLGKRGQGPIWSSLQRAGDHFGSACDGLRKDNQRRDGFMAQLQGAMKDAREANARGDEKAFAEAAARIGDRLMVAANSHLSVAGLGNVAVVPEAKPQVAAALTSVGSVVDGINDAHVNVVMPYYEPMDARTAVKEYPQPLAWAAAIGLELFGLMCLGLALTIWRDPPDDDFPNAPTFDPPNRLRRLPPPVWMQPAE